MNDPVPDDDAPDEAFVEAFRELFRRFHGGDRPPAPDPSAPSSPTDSGDS